MKDKKPDKATREEKIEIILMKMGGVYDKHLTNPTIEVYHQLWSPYPVKDIGAACRIWMSTPGEEKYRFFPRPSDIIGIIDKNKGPSIDIDARALQQWQIVLQAIRQYGTNKPQRFADPITQHLIKTQFTWNYLCTMPEFDQKWEQKRWMESFVLTASSREDLKQIEIPKQVLGLLDRIKEVDYEPEIPGDPETS